MTLFKKYVVEGILASNQYDINDVVGIGIIKTGFFHREEYDSLEKIIHLKDVSRLESYEMSEKKTDEFLSIVEKQDQRFILKKRSLISYS